MDIAALSRLMDEAHEAAAERGGGAGTSELELVRDGRSRFPLLSPGDDRFTLRTVAYPGCDCATVFCGMQDTRGAPIVTPATMVAAPPAVAAASGASSSKGASDPNAIWGEEEVPNEDDADDDDPSDARPRPEYVACPSRRPCVP